MIEPKALDDPKLQELIQVLIEWINDELAAQRIIVQDIVEDLYDGQVLQKLLEKLTGDKLDVPEVTQSEEGQKQKLFVVLNHFNKVSFFHISNFIAKSKTLICLLVPYTSNIKIIVVYIWLICLLCF